VASTIFTAISLFNQLRFPLFFYPMLIDSLANGKNSLRRISSYLTSEELTPYVDTLPSTDGGSIEVSNGNFLWPTSDTPKDGLVSSPDSPALCDINLKVNPGEIVAVVGPVGSGKSALLQGLLGELAPVPRMVVDSYGGSPRNIEAGELIDRPSVKAKGNIAYCSQEAWISKGNVRDAIVFGRDYDESRYVSAIHDAGLDRDIASGVFSHDTDVGEGGSSLSGGQRARVALARTLYSGDDTKVFLLDDCLAALDASVGSLVFERVKERVKSSKSATILVSNDPSLPRRCDRVVLMGPTSATSSCSTIIDSGTYDELLARGHQLISFSPSSLSVTNEQDVGPSFQKADDSHGTNQEDERAQPRDTIRTVGGYKINTKTTDLSCHADPEMQEVDCVNNPDHLADRATLMDIESGMMQSKATSEDDVAEQGDTPSYEQSNVESGSRSRKLISADDQMSMEAVPFSTYINYLKSVKSPKLIFGMILAFAATNGAQFFQQYTVAKWTELARGDTMAAALGSQYLKSLVYAAGAVSVFLWFRSYLTMLVGLRASDFYHSRMVKSVFRAPMSFFDATPSGQILSRFGKEMATIDRALPESYSSVLFCALQISTSVLALAGAVTPIMVLPIMFAGSLYYKTMARFRRAARDMKRSETKTRSPIFTHFSEALGGTAIIRSVPGASQTWSKTHRNLSDLNLSVFSTVKALDRWLSTRLEALGNFMVLSTALTSVFLCRAGRLTAGKAGWGITQSLAITG
jgi:ABC-type multidrug transport system fused ATPase/permease subunit